MERPTFTSFTCRKLANRSLCRQITHTCGNEIFASLPWFTLHHAFMQNPISYSVIHCSFHRLPIHPSLGFVHECISYNIHCFSIFYANIWRNTRIVYNICILFGLNYPDTFDFRCIAEYLENFLRNSFGKRL